jgi:flagellar hook-basal body complex protein FliE
MSNMEIDRVLAQIRSVSQGGGVGGIGGPRGTGGPGAVDNGFAKLLKQGLDSVNQVQNKATTVASQFERGVPGVVGSAQLEVTLNQSIERLAFAPDQAASRSDYVGAASWRLRGANGLLLASGGVTERASFNFADSPYADLAAQTAAQERLASLLARSIREQVLIEAGKPRAADASTAPAPASPGQ